MIGKLTQRVLLAGICCFALILIPLSAAAQTPGGVIKEGAEGVQKGAETGVEKTKEGAVKAGEATKEGVEKAGEATKEGAETVGKETKKAVTGEETTTTREKSTTPSMEPSQATTPQPRTEGGVTKSEPSTTTKAPETGAREKGERLPGTAGALPLLALVGGLAFAASGTLRLLRRSR